MECSSYLRHWNNTLRIQFHHLDAPVGMRPANKGAWGSAATPTFGFPKHYHRKISRDDLNFDFDRIVSVGSSFDVCHDNSLQNSSSRNVNSQNFIDDTPLRLISNFTQSVSCDTLPSQMILQNPCPYPQRQLSMMMIRQRNQHLPMWASLPCKNGGCIPASNNLLQESLH